LTSLCGTSSAQVPPFVLGYLTCILAGESDASAPGQGREALCQFRPGRSGPEETYVGTLQGFGPTQALFGKGTLILAVKGPPSTEVAPGLLEQSYSADSTKPTAAAIPLIGETNKSIALQPMTEQEGRVSAGSNKVPDAAIVLVELKLKSSPA
jgi:hypothetical protein